MSVTLLPGDCRSVLATLPDASVQCCVTSPPYFGLRAYLPDGHPDKAREIGAEPSPDAYVAEMVAVFREIRRVLADSGCVFLNLGDAYADKQLLMMPARVALALQADAWVLRSDIIWAKPNPMPESVTSRPTSAHEHVFLLSKRERYFWDAAAVAEPAETADHHERYGEAAKGYAAKYKAVSGQSPQTNGAMMGCSAGGTRNLRNVWSIATSPTPFAHFATMPPELAERCIKAGTSERGQCPHCAAPWARVVERTAGVAGEAAERPKQTAGMASKTSTLSMSGNGSKVWQERGPKSKITGWQPTCACPEHAPVPQSVLDPFAGAGTTLLVADRLGRNGVGIELNPDYARLARDRITDDAPLFASVALSEAAD